MTPYLRARRWERWRPVFIWLFIIASVAIAAVEIGYRVQELGR